MLLPERGMSDAPGVRGAGPVTFDDLRMTWFWAGD